MSLSVASLLLAVGSLLLGPGQQVFAASGGAPGDEVITGSGDAEGYHLSIASAAAGWAWSPLATIAPGGGRDQRWLGQQCLTGDGRFAVVVVAPQSAAGGSQALIAGGLAYSVDVSNGQVRALMDAVSVAYFDPGCGAGSTAAFVRYLDAGESRTRVTTVDVATGASIVDVTVTGEVTSAIPAGRDALAVLGADVVRIGAGGGVARAAHTDGLPYELRPGPAGGADFLVAPPAAAAGSPARLWQLRGSTARAVASGTTGTVHLFLGRGGRNTVVGARAPSGQALAQRTLAAPRGPVEDVSLDGQVIRTATTRLVRSDTGAAVPFASRPRKASVSHATPARGPAPGPAPGVRVGSPATPACAVARNDPGLQAAQPSGDQVDWAIQEGVRNLLTAANSRPAGYLNLGLPAYAPSSDFPAPALQGGGSVPAQVVEGILAAESNWDQASPHAPRGTAGNPLIANYYGTDSTFSTIDYSQADCGYGVGQVTSFMTAADGSQPQSIKDKVAVDYAENTAAAIGILAGKWNQLRGAGIVINGGDPAQLEDWYFAIWAYNTGVHPNLGDGSPWGLGWLNNPINPTFPPDRQPFLRTTLDDAMTPDHWPYQEQVFGWMETALWDSQGNPMYQAVLAHSGSYLRLPAHSAFCSPSRNACDPTQAQPCTRSDLECWWHAPVGGWCGSPGCHAAYFTVSGSEGEPATFDPNPPVCSLDSSFPAGTVVVALEPSDVNVVGCPNPPANWASAGTYAAAFGESSSGAPTGVIDYHQLGGGFGGYFAFTHTEPASDAANTVTATWTPPGSAAGRYEIMAFVPDFGATTADAVYQIEPGGGAGLVQQPLNQNAFSNQWVSLGQYTLGSGAQVALSNVTSDGTGVDDVAFSALAFVPR